MPQNNASVDRLARAINLAAMVASVAASTGACRGPEPEGTFQRAWCGSVALSPPLVAAVRTAPRAPEPSSVPEGQPSPRSDPGNLALNFDRSGMPSPLESSRGWGGGAKPWELVDGIRNYTSWQHGLAATGGTGKWMQASCGWRHVVIDFGEPKTWSRVMAWHHGAEHIPHRYRIEHFADGEWVTDVATERGHDHLLYPKQEAAKDAWWNAWSTPTENCFTPVRSSRVRFSFDNCDIQHGWVYELEVYADPDPERPKCSQPQ